MSDQPAERANIHEARLAQESLQYQPRQGSEALALVYQIVGCYLLATSALSILQTTATLLVVPGTITLPLGAQYTVANVDWLVVMAGAIAMLRLRGWGAMCVLLGESLKFAGSLLVMAIQPNVSSAARRLTYVTLISGSFHAIVYAFLSFAIWRVCRKHGVFGTVAA